MKMRGLLLGLLVASIGRASLAASSAGDNVPLSFTEEEARHWQSVDVTPLGKVIELLQAMISKAAADQQQEQKDMAKYNSWCNQTQTQKTKAIAAAATDQSLLNAQINDLASKISACDTSMTQSDQSVVTLQAQASKAVTDRAAAKATYDASVLKYMRSIQAVTNAANENEKADQKVAQAPGFLQVSQQQDSPDDAQRKIDAFLATREEMRRADSMLDRADDAPQGQVDAYGFQSAGITSLLRKLADRFTTEKTNLEQAEATAAQNQALLMQNLNNQITQAQATKAATVTDRANKVTDRTAKQKTLTDLNTQQKADQDFLASVQSSCNQKNQDFNNRQGLRQQEKDALQQAVDALGSDAIKVKAAKLLANDTLLQLGKGSSFSCLRASKPRDIDAQLKLVDFLQMRARELDSDVLAMLAMRVEADPFAKVKQMISDLVANLQKQQATESTQDLWCTTNLKSNEATRKEKSADMATLQAQIAQLQADKTKNEDDANALRGAIVTLYQNLNTSNAQRNKDHAANAATVQDAIDAQAALSAATKTLKDFYSSTFSTPPALLQDTETPANVSITPPPTFAGDYKGMTGQKDGVIGLLEVVQSDFARVQKTTAAAETASQAAYQKFQQETQLDITAKQAEIDHKTTIAQQDDDAIKQKQTDLAAMTNQLKAANDTWASIRNTCEVKQVNTAQKRQEEIQSLRDSLTLLNSMR